VNGGLDFFERGVARPDLVLADLIKVFHPSLARDHRFVFYVRLPKT
jgi:iron complex transport system substrate-binding protein